MSATQSPPLESKHRRWPLYWFAVLEAALEAGNLAEAAEAKRQLQILGIHIEIDVPWSEEVSNEN